MSPATLEITDRNVTAEELRARVQQLNASMVDAIIPSAAIKATLSPRYVAGSMTVRPGARLVLEATDGSGTRVGLTDGAHKQLASRLGVPGKYWEKMLDEVPELAVETVNRWQEYNPANRLYRMMKAGEVDPERAEESGGVPLLARAVLSDRYRPLDHVKLLDTVLPEAEAAGAAVASYTLTPERLMVRWRGVQRDLQPQIEALLRANGRELRGWPNEVVSFGLVTSNSETGHGALAVEPWVEVLRCLNGMRVMENMRVAHIGRKRSVVELEEGEDNNWGQDTLAVDDAATFLKVRDKVREIFLPTTSERIAGVIAAGAAAEPLRMPMGVPVIQWMGRVGEANLNLSESETSVLQEEVLHELSATHQIAPTRWSVSQAITALARRTERPERQHELEALGWTVLTDETEKLLKVAAAAAARN